MGGKTSTSFKKGQITNPKGRASLTDAQRTARDMRAQCQPELIERLLRVVRESDDNKDVVAAAKALLEEMPLEVRDVTEREPERPLEELLAIGLGALMAKRGAK